MPEIHYCWHNHRYLCCIRFYDSSVGLKLVDGFCPRYFNTLAGDVAGLVGGQKGDDVCNVFGLCDTSQGNRSVQCVNGLVRIQAADLEEAGRVAERASGSAREEIREAISYGVIKMNIDTDTQWAAWDGVRAYEAEMHDYLQSQIGNPEGDDKPNKKIYDPRMWLRASEESIVRRMQLAFEDLNCMNRN